MRFLHLRLYADSGILPRRVSAAPSNAASPGVGSDVLNARVLTACYTATAYGVGVGIRAEDPALLARLLHHLPPASQPTAGGAIHHWYSVASGVPGDSMDHQVPCYIGYSGDTPFLQTSDLASLCEAFESTVRFDVSVATTEYAFVHAGVVGWHGRAIVVPARTMHGKSRLVLALVRRGGTYYSDEFAVIDRQGLVHPFRIPASIRDDSGAVRRVTLEDAGCHAAPALLPIGLVVSTRYEAGAVWQPRRGTRGEAMISLLSNTVRARLAPREMITILASAVEGACMLEGARGEADELAPWLLEEIP